MRKKRSRYATAAPGLGKNSNVMKEKLPDPANTQASAGGVSQGETMEAFTSATLNKLEVVQYCTTPLRIRDGATVSVTCLTGLHA